MLIVNNTSGQIVQSGFRGIGANYMGFAEMADLAAWGMTAPLKAIEYQRVADSGVGTVSTWWGADWIEPTYPVGSYNFTSTRELAFEAWLTEMQSLGIKVVIKLLWTFPSDICGTPDLACTPTGGNLTTFAHLVSDVLDHLVNAKGFTNIVASNFFTEPNFPNGTVPGGDAEAYYASVVTAARAQIASDDSGRTPILGRVALTGPSEENQGDDTWIKYMIAHAGAQFDAYSSHRYCITPQFGPLGLSALDCFGYASEVSFFSAWVSDTSPKELTIDEGNYLGANNTATGLDEYHATGDAGILNATLVGGQVYAGVKRVLPWMMQDQWWPDFSTVGYNQHFGLWGRWVGQTVSVPPSWFAMAPAARLSFGGGTTVYKTTGGTATVHALAFKGANGDSGCSDAAGCFTIEVINESATALSVTLNLDASLSGRTLYRYVFNAEAVPRARSDKAAFVQPWDESFAGVTTFVSPSKVPAHSVAWWSTVDLRDPPATTLLTGCVATASATTSGSPANLVDGNETHVSGAGNAWTAGGSGSQWAQIDCPSPVTLNRIELEMVGSSPPRWWADYLTNASPAPPDQYTLQWWDGAAFQALATVTSNSQYHRTHTFAAVTSTRFRLVVPNAPSAAFTELGGYFDASTPDTALGLYGYTAASGTGQITYHQIATISYAIQAGDRLEYDVLLHDRTDYALTAKPGTGGVDVTIDAGCSSTELRNVAGWTDQNGVSGDPAADLTSRAYATWYHRVIAFPSCAVGHNAVAFALAQIRSDHVTANPNYGSEATSFFDNIKVTHSDGSTALSGLCGRGAADDPGHSLDRFSGRRGLRCEEVVNFVCAPPTGVILAIQYYGADEALRRLRRFDPRRRCLVSQ